ncbi:MAG: restriction endonuclease subunit S [Gammaproteobacteria bacterium]|nr:restriction endonuclease subunit S [Gammaproteobacteria bacterium]
MSDLVEGHFCGPSPDCEERPIFEDAEWGVLKTTAITWGGWDETAHKVLPKAFWNKNELEVRDGDVLVTKAGPRHRVGVVCHVTSTRRQLIVSGKMIGLRPRLDLVEPSVMAGLIAREIPQKWIHDRTTGMAESQVNFANGVLLNTPLRLPPLNEQRQIAKILATVRASIQDTEAVIAKLKALKHGLLHDLLTRGIDANGELRPPRTEAPHLYKQSSLGWIPKDWASERLGRLALKIVDGVHQTPRYVSAGIPFITIKNLTASQDISFASLNYISARDHREFCKRADPKPGDVLVTKDGTLGVARIVHDAHPEFSIFVSVAQIRPDVTRLLPHLLLAFFDSEHYHAQMGAQSGGSGLKHIHLEQFREFVIPLPPLDEQTVICKGIADADQSIEKEESTLNELAKLSVGLTDDLLTGRVRVTPLLEAAAL